MAQNWDFLATRKINGVMQSLRDVRELPKALKFLNRTQIVPATDGEIMARFDGEVYAADIIADDQKAVVRDTGKFTFEQIKIPNLKHGNLVTQEHINMMARINAGGGIPADKVGLDNYINGSELRLLTGIEQRMEALIVAMQIDAFSYDRLGIKISGATWGMPADLKVTVGTPWSTAASATPIANIWAVRTIAREKYGRDYNRVSMSTTNFLEMIATTEFINKAQLYSQRTFPTATFPMDDRQAMESFGGMLLGIEIEIYDAQYTTEGTSGTLTRTRFLPDDKVVLSNSADDNNGEIMDFANGIVTESIVADLMDNGFGGFGGPQYGPVSYATGNADLNPPNLILWGVARGFPRKHDLAATSVLTV